MSFPQHFRELAVPRLIPWLRLEAECVCRGIETFTQAFYVVHREARRLGALHLEGTAVAGPNGGTQDGLEALEDWIATTLLAEIEKAERGGAQ